MNCPYPHLLAPLTVGGRTLKSHYLSAKCISSQMNDFEAAGAFYEMLAKNGAATVTMAVGAYPDCEGNRSHMSPYHMDDPEIQASFRRMIDRCHAHGTLCAATMMGVEPMNVNISDTPDWTSIPMTGDYSMNLRDKPGISAERLEGMISDFAAQCADLKRIGFDMVVLYMSYRGSILACSLSPLLNQRTDKYGGKTMAERATLTLEIFRRIKEACGSDFLIEAQISAEEEAPGYTMEDWLTYCKLCEGLVDIFQIRGWDGSYTHVNGHNAVKTDPINLKFAEAFKKRGISALVSPVGGVVDPASADRAIAEGRTDLVHMARALIADDQFGEKLAANRASDIRPCLLCNRCHGGSCSVNPKDGYYPVLDKWYPPAKSRKKVAVLGGGPAGLNAALYAADRGHSVTLFEKTDRLGGQLNLAAAPSFKWPLRDYRDWLLREVAQAPIEVRLNTTATPELLRASGFDAIVCALGSAPKSIPVPGAEGPHAWRIDDVFGNEAALGRRVVVVGGQSTGRETALHLAKLGHEVVLVTRGKAMLYDDLHSKRASELDFEHTPNFSYVEYFTTQKIGSGSVLGSVEHGHPAGEMDFETQMAMMEQEEAKKRIRPDFPAGIEVPELPPVPGISELGGPGGPPPRKAAPELHLTTETRRIECDDVVVSGGRVSRAAEASAFAGLAPQVFVIGDNVRPDDLMHCSSSAFAAAMKL